MTMIDSTCRSSRIVFLAILLLTTGMTVCSDDDVKPENPEEEEVKEITTGVYTLKNLVTDSAATFASGAQPVYYSLEDGRVVPPSQAQTNKWDICFNGSYNSSICANNGSLSKSPGYGGPGKGAVFMVINSEIDDNYYNGPGNVIKNVPSRDLFNQAFDAVKTADVAVDIWDIDGIIGLDYFSGTASGWSWYDFYGQLFPDKSYDLVGHVAYALPRVLIVKTAKGNYAKLVIYSLYKDAPESPDRTYKPGFVTMKYAIQKDGTTNLNIEE